MKDSHMFNLCSLSRPTPANFFDNTPSNSALSLWDYLSKFSRTPSLLCETCVVHEASHLYYQCRLIARWYIRCPLHLQSGWLDNVLYRLTLLSKLKTIFTFLFDLINI